MKLATTKERTMKSSSTPPKTPLPARVLAELKTLAELWGNPGDDADPTPPRHLRPKRARR